MAHITAKQLAEELLKNPNDIVCSVSDNFELSGAVIPKTSTYLSRFLGEISREGFIDAFDGGSYTKEIVKRVFENGSINFVQI